MPMSNTQWMAWKPENLLHDESSVEPEFRPTTTATDPATEAAMQVELSRLRQQAEKKGYAQGQTRGIEEGKAQGYEEGFQQGLQEGIAQGLAGQQQRQQEQLAQFAQLIDNFNITLDSLDSVMTSRLVQVALMATRSMLGESALTANAHQWLMTRIQQLLNEESLRQGSVKLWVSDKEPESLLQQLKTIVEPRGWELCLDAQMLPGGCRISTDSGDLDASVETRWNTLCTLSREGITL